MNRAYWQVAILILILAATTRLWQLGRVPAGLTWDEAAIGYNGYAVLNTRRDEWLVKLPISFRSFGDYKAPLAIYLNGFFTQVAGLTPLGIRLPFALAGIFSVVLVGWLTFVLAKSLSNQDRWYLALSAMFILAVSPWHTHFSRVGFESGLALFIIVLGTVLWLSGRRGLAALVFALSLYTYHSAKVFTPLWLGYLMWLGWRSNKQSKRTIWPLGLFVLALLPFLKDSLLGEGLTRAGVTIFSQSHSLTELVSIAGRTLWAHLDPQFWLLGKADTLRHSSGALGVLYLTDVCLLGLSLVIKLSKRKLPSSLSAWWQKTFKLGLVWMLLGLLPALIGVEAPHPNRALLALPGLIILVCLGLIWLWHQKGEWRFGVLGCLAIAQVILTSAFLHNYFGRTATQNGTAFLEGTFEVAQLATRFVKGQDVSGVSEVLFSSANGQPYIYVLLASRMNPIVYRGGGLAQFGFPDQIKDSDLVRSNTLLIATPTDPIDKTAAFTQIIGRDGQVRYYVYRTSVQ